MNYRMTIIIPVFNEIDNLERISTTFNKYFSQSNTKSKLLFIDDGSTDNSFAKIIELCANNSNYEYLKFNKNCGLSTAIKAGIDHCNTELIGYIDADLQTSPFDFDLLLKDIDDYDASYRISRKKKGYFEQENSIINSQ